MSKLDQAFSRVYQRTGVEPASAKLGTSDAIPLTEALRRGGRERSFASDEPPSGIPLDVLAIPAADSEPARNVSPALPDVVSAEWRIRSRERLDEAPRAVESDGPALRYGVFDPEQDSKEALHLGEPERDAEVANGVVEETPLQETTFRPMLQVEAFAWPIHLAEPSEEFEAELDAAAAVMMELRGCRAAVVGFAGSAAGAGCTTMLLGIASRLARRGVDVVLVDANCVSPMLASTLGLLPSAGWEDVVDGNEPLTEVLIESVEDRMTLLPMCDGPRGVRLGDAELADTRAQSVLATLREHFDLVLVDLGTVDNDVAGVMDREMDDVILVHDVRRASPERARACRQGFESRQLDCVGVIENFAPSASDAEYRRAA
jgi:Mrp family chromosome partitioning ATPase